MGELVRLTFPDRAQWLAGRHRGIGGSEAAAAIGRSPWKTALTLWKEKTGAQAAPDLSGNEAVELGRRMEPAIRDFFMAQYPGYELYYGAYDILYQSDRPWLFATLDGELTETDTGRKGILEIKTSTVSRGLTGRNGGIRFLRTISRRYFTRCLPPGMTSPCSMRRSMTCPATSHSAATILSGGSMKRT